jgi:hypothetical protein
LKSFWGFQVFPDVAPWTWDWTPEVRSKVWEIFAERWMQSRNAEWENVVILLCAPFV